MSNVVLIGFMGSGKTAVGCGLARVLNYKFVDVDELIEKKQNQTIIQIFENQGESAFRKLETDTINKVVQEDEQVVSCGGGAVIDKRNVEMLRESGIFVYLKASTDVLYQRVKNGNSRPLLNVANPRKQLEELLHQREKIYERVADVTFDTTGKDVNEIVDLLGEEIKGRLGEKN